MSKKHIAVKFVHWDVCSIEQLKNSRVYNLRKRLNNGDKMSREDKNWLTENLRNNEYFHTAVPLSGYFFDFSDVIRKYIVNQDGKWNEYYAPDKASLRNILLGTIYHIIEIKGIKIKFGEYK